MKKLILTMAIVATAFGLQAQEFPKADGSPMDASYYPPRAQFRNFAETEAERKAGEPKIRVIYSRPQVKGRDIFGGLQKYGEMWRIGANEATEILFFQDVTVGETKIKAGRYTIYAMVNESSWDIHFSTDLDTWGQYRFDPAKSGVAKITVPTQKTASTVEYMSILFQDGETGADMIIGWDDTMVSVPIGL